MQKSFKGLLKSVLDSYTESAMAIGQGVRDAIKPKRELSVAEERHRNKGSVKERQAGRGTPGKHYVKRQQQGPFYRQIGVRHMLNSEGEFVCTKRIMQAFYIMRVLHGTKGWRTKTFAAGTRLM